MIQHHFSEFEAFSEAIAHADLRMRVLGFERPQYSIAHASVGRLQLQCAQEGSGHLTEGASDRRVVGLFVRRAATPARVNGRSVGSGDVVYIPPGSEFCFSGSHASGWFTVTMPRDLIYDRVPEISKIPDPPHAVSVIEDSPQLTHRLRRMVRQYMDARSRTSAVANGTLAAQEFEREMLWMARQVARPTNAGRSAGQERVVGARMKHQRIASEAAELIEATLDGGHTIEGLAYRLGVSTSTLRSAFHSRFGLSPRKFAQALRLNRARQLLKKRDHGQTNVADIAAECGYWDFGRFASRYQTLFGELPSETLQR